MTPPSAIAIVLAAGLGTRMRSHRPKVLHPLCGRPMLGYVLEAAREATGQRPLVVYSPTTVAVREAFADEAEFARQDEPRGTGDAVRAALAAVPAGSAEVIVLSGDTPLLRAGTVRELAARRRRTRAAMALVAVEAYEPSGLGRIVRDGRGRIERIVEEKDATLEELEIAEINAGLYAFDAAWVRGRIGDLTASGASRELYITDLVALARHDRRTVTTLDVEDDGSLIGINDRVQLADAERALRTAINDRHMRAGVTMRDPATAYVDVTVELAADVVLEPNVILRGRTRIGEGTVVGAGSQIIDSVVGRDCLVWASVLEEAEVEDEVQVGPFAHLRPGASIARGAKLGNFAEVKKSRLGPGVQQHHFSYIGDAEVGAGVNIGAGTITANYDGVRKNRTIIGEGAFIGSDSMLVAPIEIGPGAVTAAGSVVTRNVPAGKLAIGVPARIRERKHDAGDNAGPPRKRSPAREPKS